VNPKYLHDHHYITHDYGWHHITQNNITNFFHLPQKGKQTTTNKHGKILMRHIINENYGNVQTAFFTLFDVDIYFWVNLN
jgi:hypothetical protein